MLRRTLEERVLRRVTAETRRSPLPELGWDALEAELLARTAAGDTASRSAPARRFPRWTLALLPAAALALLPIFSAPPAATPPSAKVVETTASFDGDALAPERVIVANDKPVSIVHAGRAEWQLEPGSAASVIEHDHAIHVRLTRGALRARVVPATEPDRFVVEVGDTRVAVRGTTFRVELLGDQSRVIVEEGVVAVGPNRGPHALARLLHAPAEGRFSLNGTPIDAPTARVTPLRAPLTRSVTPPPSTPAASASAETPVIAKELTIGEVEAGVSALVKTLSDCFAQSTSGAGDVRISARTSVTLNIAPSGALADVVFVPPLAPRVQACSERTLKEVRFAASEVGARVTRVLEFAR